MNQLMFTTDFDDAEYTLRASLDKGLEKCDKLAEYTQLILDNFEGIWLLIQSGCEAEACMMFKVRRDPYSCLLWKFKLRFFLYDREV